VSSDGKCVTPLIKEWKDLLTQIGGIMIGIGQDPRVTSLTDITGLQGTLTILLEFSKKIEISNFISFL